MTIMTHQHRDTGSIGLALVILLALLTALDAMAIDMYLPGMPAIAQAFDTSAGRIQQTLSIFLAGLAIGQGLYGPLLDRYGRRLPLLAGVAVFIAGSMMGAMATSIDMLLAARFLQALGAAAGLVTPRAIVADRCNLKESSRILSLLMQVMMIGPILAPILGGWLLNHGDWRLIFWAMAALGLAGLLWGLYAIPDSLPRQQRIPLNVRSITSAYASVLRRRVFMTYTLASGLVLGSFFAYISGSAFIFTHHFGLNATQFSYLFAANSIGLVLGGLCGNRLLALGMPAPRAMMLGLGLYTATGLLLLAAVWVGPDSLLLYAVLLALSIASLGLVFGNLTALTMHEAGAQVGIGSALMGMLQYLISAVIGFAVSLTPVSPAQLPGTIAICGALTCLACHLAAGAGRKEA